MTAELSLPLSTEVSQFPSTKKLIVNTNGPVHVHRSDIASVLNSFLLHMTGSDRAIVIAVGVAFGLELK